MKCKRHPRYTGTYRPRGHCITCWRMYATTHPLEAAEVWNDVYDNILRNIENTERWIHDLNV